MTKRCFQTTSRLGVFRALDVAQGSLRDDFPAMRACARAKIDNMVSAPHRLVIVLDNDQRVPLLAQCGQRVE